MQAAAAAHHILLQAQVAQVAAAMELPIFQQTRPAAQSILEPAAAAAPTVLRSRSQVAVVQV